MPPKNDAMSFSFDLTPGESVVNWDCLVNAFGLDPDDAMPFSEPNCSADEAVPDDDKEEVTPMLNFIPHSKVIRAKSVIFSGPATTIIWSDGSKTTVKVSEGQEYDRYAGFCAAIVKKLYGSTSAAKREMDKADVDLQRQARAAEKEVLRKKRQEDGVKARRKKAMEMLPSHAEFDRRVMDRAVEKAVEEVASLLSMDIGKMLNQHRTVITEEEE